MCNESALATIFGRFAGREITLLERPGYARLADDNDPTVAAMENVATLNNYSLRLHLPGMKTGQSYDPHRANVYVESSGNGTGRVSSRFHVG